MTKSPSRKNKNNVQYSIILFILGTAVIVSLGYFMVYLPKQAARTQAGNAVPYVELAIADVPLQAALYSEKAGFEGGIAYFDTQIEHRANPVDKRQLLVYKSDFAANGKKYDLALEALRRAEQISPDVSVTVAQAQIYEAQGDKKAAIEKYTNAIAMESSSDSEFSDRYSYRWRYKIEALSH